MWIPLRGITYSAWTCGFLVHPEVAETRCFRERCHINVIQRSIWQEKNRYDSYWPEEQVAFLTFKKKSFNPVLSSSRNLFSWKIIFNSPEGCILEWGYKRVAGLLVSPTSFGGVRKVGRPQPALVGRMVCSHSISTPQAACRLCAWGGESWEPAGWDQLTPRLLPLLRSSQESSLWLAAPGGQRCPAALLHCLLPLWPWSWPVGDSEVAVSDDELSSLQRPLMSPVQKESTQTRAPSWRGSYLMGKAAEWNTWGRVFSALGAKERKACLAAGTRCVQRRGQLVLREQVMKGFMETIGQERSPGRLPWKMWR